MMWFRAFQCRVVGFATISDSYHSMTAVWEPLWAGSRSLLCPVLAEAAQKVSLSDWVLERLGFFCFVFVLGEGGKRGEQS